MATEILHHHPNSKMEDYCNIYELMKHSGVKDYLMVSLHAGALDCAGRLHSADTDLTLVLVGSSRSVWNTPFTSCFMATWWMQSVSCLLLRAGGTGTRQLLRNREENSLRPTGVYWIISSGVTKSAPSPTRVRWCVHQHPLHLLVSSIQTVWCHSAIYWSKIKTTLNKSKIWSGSVFCSWGKTLFAFFFNTHIYIHIYIASIFPF